MIGSPDHPVLTFGLPPDAVSWATLFLALVIPLIRVRMTVQGRLLLLSAAAATLSWGYFNYYLGGAPRIIDATAYLLEARTFSQGSFSFEVPSPTASFRGRFLIHTATDPNRLAAIFPPGYPALLSLGVALRSPFVIGPLLAAGLVVSTYLLTFAVTRRKGDALVAAGFSTICACLRYHTAETMSHGFSALLTTLALFATVESMRSRAVHHQVILGLSLGLLCATRQLNGVVMTVTTVTWLLVMKGHTLRRISIVVVCMVPGIALLLAHQHSITGDFFTSPQTRYYDFSDGPPGCFALGLGSGCAYEHADVVARQGGHGLTPQWMVLNTLHRFHYHLMDVAHFEPLVLVGAVGLWWGRKRRFTWPLIATLLALPLGYSLFYFAGSYPGGGARLFSEMIPIWHVAIAWGLRRLRLVRWGVVACLVGFALHASFSHRALSEPRFGPPLKPTLSLPELVERQEGESSSSRPLVLMQTAHEFNVAHLEDDSFLAARRTFDSRERLVRDTLGSPPVFAFGHDSAQDHPKLELLSLDESATLIFESEFDYPPLAKRDLWAVPEYLPHSCVSRGRALALHRAGPRPRLELEVPVAKAAGWAVTLWGVQPDGSCVSRVLQGTIRDGRMVLGADVLRNLSHIDRLQLTPTHP